ncbi:unnamed protein product [Rotaria sp. Silwood1]|nr:unnamed protein product [Rotaria sp. Silwood1]
MQTSIKKRVNLQPVLFQITADTAIKSIVFANVEEFSCDKSEREVLFSIGTAFKVENVKFDKELNAWIVGMAMTEEGMKNIQDYIVYMKNLFNGLDHSLIFGCLMNDMGYTEKAEKYFNLLLYSSQFNSLEQADILHELGHVNFRKQDVGQSYNYHRRAMKIRRNVLQPNDARIAVSNKAMRKVFWSIRHFDYAIEYNTEALRIDRANAQNHDHLTVTKDLSGLGKCYRGKADFRMALEYLNQPLEMR